MAKRNPSMGGLELPEDMNINEELGHQLIGDSFGKGSGQMSNQINMLAESSFATASKNYEGIEKVDDLSKAKAKAKKAEEQDFMRGAYKANINRYKKTVDGDSGIKIGKRRYGVLSIVRTCVIVVIVIFLFSVFIPPYFLDNLDDTRVEETNIFYEKGINDVKVQYENDYNMISPEALRSEKYQNYREITLSFRVINFSPLQTKVPQFTLAKKQSEMVDRIIYVGNANTRNDDVIQPFSTAIIKVKVLVNIEDLDSSGLNKLIRGMVLETEEMERRITKDKYLPTLPVYIFVSNNISVSL